jgi:hypothetical protein
MTTTYGNRSIFSKIEARIPSIFPGLDNYLVEIELVLTPNNPSAGALIADDLRLVVSMGNTRVGVARPAANSNSFFTVRQSNSDQRPEIQHFELVLSRAAMARLEEIRNGQSAVFQIALLCNIAGYGTNDAEPRDIRQDVPWPGDVLLNAPPGWIFKPKTGRWEHIVTTIAASDWIKLLDKAGYQSLMLLEIEIPNSHALGPALHDLKAAHSAFLEGRYEDTVARCRHALESALPDKDCPWNETTNKNSRDNMTVEARFRLNCGTLRHITHSAHHHNKMAAQFTRPMAQYVLHATYLVLELLSKERDLLAKPASASP